MKKLFLVYFLSLIFCGGHLFATDNIEGYWKTIDDKTGKPQSMVAIYDHDGKYFGRIILTYDVNGNPKDTIEHPSERAPGIVGNPYYAGLDIIWDLQKDGATYKDGQVVDPEEGKVYGAKMWREGDNLIVRGEILFFGRNQAWLPARDNDFPPGFQKPDLKKIVPKIPEVVE